MNINMKLVEIELITNSTFIAIAKLNDLKYTNH